MLSKEFDNCILACYFRVDHELKTNMQMIAGVHGDNTTEATSSKQQRAWKNKYGDTNQLQDIQLGKYAICPLNLM